MHDWVEYVNDLLGEPCQAVPDPEAERRLPVFLGNTYALFSGMLLERPTCFAVFRSDDQPPAVEELKRDHAALRRLFGEDVVLVLGTLPAYGVKQLVKERVPFLIPRQQVFLPRNIVYLRGDPVAPAVPGHAEDTPLTTRAQIFLLYHLQRHSLALQTQTCIAEMLSWPAMAVSRAVRELQQKRLCGTLPGGRTNTLAMGRGRALWERALPLLVSPVKIRRFVRILKPDLLVPPFHEAGLSALSYHTMINADPVAVFAAHHRDVVQFAQHGVLQERSYREPGDIVVELWRYSPAFLAPDAKTVDRLSLFLSLKDSPDERVQGALQELLEGMPW